MSWEFHAGNVYANMGKTEAPTHGLQQQGAHLHIPSLYPGHQDQVSKQQHLDHSSSSGEPRLTPGHHKAESAQYQFPVLFYTLSRLEETPSTTIPMGSHIFIFLHSYSDILCFQSY